MKNLNKEINVNKKFIVIMLLLGVLSIGLYYSYALFEISVIQDNVVVLKTGTVDITTEVVDNSNQTFSLAQGETKSITVNLTSAVTNDIGYKMYYDVTSGISDFIVTSTESFTNDIVEGVMNTSKTITFTFQNTGSQDLTLVLGTQGGLTGYPIPLEQGIELVLNKELGVPVKNAILTSVNNPTDTSCKTYIEEDGIIYISGTATCIDFNYVWYSGKLWRITAIYPDGTMKMITDGAITTISYGADTSFYTDENNTSYMYQWLNEDFLDTLYNYENIIETKAIWNASPGNGIISSKLPIEGQEEVLVTAPVGLLNSYEYYKSYQNTSYGSGYLNIGYYWWLLNRYSTSSSRVWSVGYSGGDTYNGPSNSFGGRPVVNLKSGVQLEGGSGTASNPYRIKGDKEDAVANTTLINTRSSGEYVKFNEELYRIVGVENETTKLIKADYVKDGTTILTKKFASSTTFGSSIETGSDDYWDYYLNKTWLKAVDSTYNETNDTSSVLAKGTYYIKEFRAGNYKGTVCTTISNTTTIEECDKTGIATWSGFVGLPRYGEMFASQTRDYTESNAKYLWLITPYSSSNVWCVGSFGDGNYYGPSSMDGGRPTIHLKSEIIIKSGSGTKSVPFEIIQPETVQE